MSRMTPGQRLRQSAFEGALTAAQGRAIAAILTTLEVADGNGTDVLSEHAEALLTSIVAQYRSELSRLERTDEVGAQAAARRREQAAARPAREAAIVETDPDVVRLDDRRGWTARERGPWTRGA